MRIRTLLAACLLLGATSASFAAEESSNSGDRPTPDALPQTRRTSPPPPPVGRPIPPPPVLRPTPPPAPVFRPTPPPPPVFREPPRREVYRDPPRREGYREPYYRPLPPPVIYRPAPRFGYTCQTRRFECELRRPRPLGEDCECETPSGRTRPGQVIE